MSAVATRRADLAAFLSCLTGEDEALILAPDSVFAVREATCADCALERTVSRVVLEDNDELDLCLDCLDGRL